MRKADHISNFVRQERDRFSDDRNIAFDTCFSQISRYYDFLQIILQRYEVTNRNFIEYTKVMTELAKTGGKNWSEEKRKEIAEYRGYELSRDLHLQLESFYLFAKILLDKIAQCIYFYFGNSQSSFQGHHTMIKNMKKYASERKLSPVPKTLFQKMNRLKEIISDFRDEIVTHQYAPRAIRATMSNSSTGESWLVDMRIMRKEGDKQREGMLPTRLMKLLDSYISEVIDYLSSNRKRARLD